MPPRDAARGVPRPGRRRRGRGRDAASSRCSSRATRRRATTALERIQVTPDPGVIEVNIHPARSWRELVANTTALYEEARAVPARHREVHARRSPHRHRRRQPRRARRRHAGRQPVPAPARSAAQPHRLLAQPPVALVPVLGPVRRPDQPGAARRRGAQGQPLRAGDRVRQCCATRPTRRRPGWSTASSATCWSTSPATPTAPRSASTSCTARTRRRAPGPGRAARVRDAAARAHELRRSSCWCAALVAWFWREPYDRKLVRWGTALHDRFMLPHFVAAGLRGRARRPAAARASRSQRAGSRRTTSSASRSSGASPATGVELELRQAIEPWHVLGEEPGGGGTVRYVDSSVERVQVKVRGMTDPRHVVACNGRRVPLHPTGTAGEFVAGVRYRAWQPPTALHPTIPRARAAGVRPARHAGPTARSAAARTTSRTRAAARTSSFPRNALEAESRRVARFFPFGHSQGKQPTPPVERSEEFPLTLDFAAARTAARLCGSARRRRSSLGSVHNLSA